MHNFFAGKKVLFISPRFFGYEREISNRLEQFGAEVVYHDDRPSNTPLMKTLIRLRYVFVREKIKKYFDDIVDEIDCNFDFVFVVKMECMPKACLQRLRGKMKKCKFIYYSWDSARNNPNFTDAIDIFDEAFTFDDEDAKQIPKIKLRPLFYLNEYSEIKTGCLEYDVSFVGTAHSDRYSLVKKIRQSLAGYGLRDLFYLYIPHQAIYVRRKIASPAFWTAAKNEFSFVPISKNKVMDIISKSKAVLDFQHPAQTGLTMRTFEMLGARKKLITTNARIKNYDFYRAENIAVVDRKNPVVDRVFFEMPSVELPADIYEKYSLDGWLAEVFGVKK